MIRLSHAVVARRWSAHAGLGESLGLLLILTAFSAACPSDIRINEIHYHPAGKDEALEFVEICNTGSESVDITAWRLFGAVSFTFPTGTTIPPAGYLAVVKDKTVAQEVFGDIPLVGDFSGRLSDRGEKLVLSDSSGRIIDSLRWKNGGAWPKGADGHGGSLEKKTPRSESDWGDNWYSSPVVNGTPGSINSRYATTQPVVIVEKGEEWRYFKGTTDPPSEWTAVSFDDTGWSRGNAGFGYGDDDDATVLDDMQFVEGSQPGYSTVYIRKKFSLEETDFVRLTLAVDFDDGFAAYINGNEVARYNAPGAAGDPVSHDSIASGSHEALGPVDFDISAAIEYLRQGENVLAIVGLNVSLSSSDFSLSPSLEAAKEVWGPAAGEEPPPELDCPVVINEVAPSSLGGWIELYNPGEAQWDLSGYHLSISPRDPALYIFPEGTTLAAEGFLVVNEADLGESIPSQGSVLLSGPGGVILVDGQEFAKEN